MPLRKILLALVPLLACVGAVQAQKPLSPVDFIELPRLSGGALSPDGNKLLYLRRTVDWTENKQLNRFRLLDLQTMQYLPTPQPDEKKDSFRKGVWHPDGSGFATVYKGKEDKHRQAYFYDIAEQTFTKLTGHHENVGNLAWSSSGDALYFAGQLADLNDVDDPLLVEKWSIKEYETRLPKGIWRFDLAQSKQKLIVGGGDFHVVGASFSDDNSKLLYRRSPTGLGGDGHKNELWLLDLVAGKTSQITLNGYREANASLSPDNRSFSYIATVNERGENYYEDNLFVQSIDSDRHKLLFGDKAIEVLEHAWHPSGQGMFVLGNLGLRSQLFYYDLAAQALEQLTLGDHAVGSWQYLPQLNAHLIQLQTATNPGDFFLLRDVDGPLALGKSQQVTHEYKLVNQQFQLPVQEGISWQGRGRQKIEGLLVYPIGWRKQEDKPFPLVTITHGGPRSSVTFGAWNTSRYVSVLAGRGYGILLPNHRGGTGYGDAFMRDMVGNYFNNAQHDVMDGIDHLIEQGLADPDRLIKMGWSAGGHMTNKLVTTTDRFKAASSGAGASEWIAMYGESDVRYNRGFWFGGTPWERGAPLRSYLRQSPLFKTWRAVTPTLLFVGGDDVRVPPTQSILMYRGLKAAGVETELFVADGEPHGYGKPRNQLFKINKELSWYSKHVLQQPYVAVLPEVTEPEADSD